MSIEGKVVDIGWTQTTETNIMKHLGKYLQREKTWPLDPCFLVAVAAIVLTDRTMVPQRRQCSENSVR